MDRRQSGGQRLPRMGLSPRRDVVPLQCLPPAESHPRDDRPFGSTETAGLRRSPAPVARRGADNGRTLPYGRRSDPARPRQQRPATIVPPQDNRRLARSVRHSAVGSPCGSSSERRPPSPGTAACHETLTARRPHGATRRTRRARQSQRSWLAPFFRFAAPPLRTRSASYAAHRARIRDSVRDAFI